MDKTNTEWKNPMPDIYHQGHIHATKLAKYPPENLFLVSEKVN